jgi:hypothetical protein
VTGPNLEAFNLAAHWVWKVALVALAVAGLLWSGELAEWLARRFRRPREPDAKPAGGSRFRRLERARPRPVVGALGRTFDGGGVDSAARRPRSARDD